MPKTDYVFHYRIRNWPEYNRALINLGRLTIRLPSLLQQIPDPLGQVSGDGAYDTKACYEAVLHRGATPTFVPRRTARPCAIQDPTTWRAPRNLILQQIEAQGR